MQKEETWNEHYTRKIKDRKDKSLKQIQGKDGDLILKRIRWRVSLSL